MILLAGARRPLSPAAAELAILDTPRHRVAVRLAPYWSPDWNQAQRAATTRAAASGRRQKLRAFRGGYLVSEVDAA